MSNTKAYLLVSKCHCKSIEIEILISLNYIYNFGKNYIFRQKFKLLENDSVRKILTGPGVEPR